MTNVYSGSWNPLHWGHLAIANYVEANYVEDLVFELCCKPLDKPELSKEEVDKRKRQFTSLNRNLIVTNNSSFLEKSTMDARILYRLDRTDLTTRFIVGYDTALRIDNPKYYFDSASERDRAIKLLASRRCTFLVFPRDGMLTEGFTDGMMAICDFADDFKECAISSSSLRDKPAPTPEYKPLTDLERYARRKDFS